MVYNRITFLTQGVPNDGIISNFIYEVVTEYALCLGIDESDIGLESAYTVAQKSFIADLVALYILAMVGAELARTDSRGEGNGTFISKAQAGSVEVMYDQFKDDEHHSLAISAERLYGFYYTSARRKGMRLGCMIDVDELMRDVYVPFKNFTEE